MGNSENLEREDSMEKLLKKLGTTAPRGKGGLGVKSMLIKQSASRSLDLVPMALKWAVMHEVINEQSYRYIISPKVCRWLLVLKS